MTNSEPSVGIGADGVRVGGVQHLQRPRPAALTKTSGARLEPPMPQSTLRS